MNFVTLNPICNDVTLYRSFILLWSPLFLRKKDSKNRNENERYSVTSVTERYKLFLIGQ